MGRRTTSTLLFSALLLLLIQSVSSKNPPSLARKEDLPFIRCQVCRKIAEELHGLVQKKQTQISPKMISELQIIDIAENVCNLKKEESDWILRIDIVEKGDTLELVDQGTEGQCNSECKTIERACQEVMEYSDTDVAEYIFKARPSINALANYLCGDLTKACSVKAPPIPKDRIPGEPFVAKSSKEAEMEKILRSMQGMPGAPNMKMYSKEDLMNMKNMGDDAPDDDDDDDDQDDDDDKFPSSLGKVLRQKETAKAEWKGRILEGVKQSGAAIKKHVDRSLYRIQKWWGGKKTGGKASKAGKAEL